MSGRGGEDRNAGREDLGRLWRTLLALGFVVVSLIALAFVPVMVERQTREPRELLANRIALARDLADASELAIAEAVSARRGYLLTGDPDFLGGYRQALAVEQRLYDRLGPVAEALGPEVVRRVEALRSISARWHGSEAELLARRVAPEQLATEQALEQQRLYEATLAAADSVREAVLAAERRTRARIERVERWGEGVTVLLVLIALASVLVVAWLGIRVYRQSREERMVRRLAQDLAGALEAAEIMPRVAEVGRGVTRARGAYVECVLADGSEVEVTATAGTGTPPIGTRVPYPGSLTEIMLERGQPQRIDGVRAIGAAIAPYLERHCDGCTALVVPLMSEGDPLGALVLLRARGRFTAEDLRRVRIIGDVASLAIRKVLLLEQAQGRGRELEHLLGVRTRLVRGISHDLKNPLGAAQAYAELLESGVRGELNPEQKEFVRRIRRSGRAMLGIIEDLLELSEAEAGELRIRREPTDVGDVAQEVTEDHRASAETAGLRLELDLAETLPEIPTDRRRVREILGNLITNAIRYTPAGGHVMVGTGVRHGRRADDPRRWVTISVTDTGPGIPPEDRERIFEEYSRLQPEGAEGSGLGLSISRKIARLLDGDLTVEGGPGGGSTFTLWLPIPSQSGEEAA